MMFFNEAFNLGPYIKQLKCYSVAMMGKHRNDVDRGGKIILPASALDHLTRLHIQFPMLFRLTNRAKNRITHCGVLEFVADEGICFLPYWLLRNLLVNEGDIIQVEYVNLDIARFAKFQPQSVDFLEISNPKAVLENALRNFACLTKGDVISINYNDKDYELCILETRPGNAVSIIECDMDVDFAPPVGYEEPTNSKNKPQTSGFKKNPITKPPEKPVNEGYRLDGKQKKRADTQSESSEATSSNKANQQKGVPFYDYPIGLLRFHHDLITEDIMETEQPKETPASKGFKLKHIGVKTS